MSDIVFQGVSRSFKRDGREQLAVDDVSLEVREREFVALVGPSGCGKTTCLRMAAGLDFPTAGTVSVGGKKVEAPGPQRTLMQEELIKLARKIPRTVLFITHAVEEAVYLADRVVVMTRRPGRIAEIVDVAPVRAAGGWDKLARVEEVMEQ